MSLFLAGADDRTPASDLPEVVERSRRFHKGWLVAFRGCGDRNAAEDYRGRYLLRPFDEVDAPDDEELFYHELLECTVETSGGDVIGRVREAYDLRPKELLEVVGPDGSQRFIPFSKEIVVEVDREGRRIVIDPPDGLLDL